MYVFKSLGRFADGHFTDERFADGGHRLTDGIL